MTYSILCGNRNGSCKLLHYWNTVKVAEVEVMRKQSRVTAGLYYLSSVNIDAQVYCVP